MKFINNPKTYHKRARMLSNLVDVVSDQYDVLHDIYLDTLLTGDNWGKCFNRRKYEYEKYGDGYKGEIEHKSSRFHAPNFNMKACKFFEEVNDILKWCGYPEGRHATNGGEKKILRYYVDFYIPEYNIVVEYNEPAHYYDSSRKAYDTRRRREIEKFFDIPIIIVHEDKETPREVSSDVIRNIEYSILKNNCKKY